MQAHQPQGATPCDFPSPSCDSQLPAGWQPSPRWRRPRWAQPRPHRPAATSPGRSASLPQASTYTRRRCMCRLHRSTCHRARSMCIRHPCTFTPRRWWYSRTSRACTTVAGPPGGVPSGSGGTGNTGMGTGTDGMRVAAGAGTDTQATAHAGPIGLPRRQAARACSAAFALSHAGRWTDAPANPVKSAPSGERCSAAHRRVRPGSTTTLACPSPDCR